MNKIWLGLWTWWGLVFTLLFLQAYFMSGLAVFVIIAVICTPIALVKARFFYTYRSKLWIRIPLLIFGLLHFIPVILQFLTVKQPGLDNLITAAVGLLILRFK